MRHYHKIFVRKNDFFLAATVIAKLQ